MQTLPLNLASGVEIEGHTGTYIIEAPIRPGGSGIVYRARMRSLDQATGGGSSIPARPLQVAIKFFLPVFNQVDDLFRAEGKDRLHRLQKWHEQELKCLRSVEHPNIVSVLDDGVFSPDEDQLSQDLKPYNNVSFLVTRFVEGEDLAEKLTKPVDIAELVEILKNVCDGLIYLHESLQYLHADIRPENIIVEKYSNRAVIIDFALYKNFNLKEMSAEGLTRITADPTTLPPDVPIKDEANVHGKRGTLKEEWFPRLDLCQFGGLLLDVWNAQVRYLAPDERDYLFVLGNELRNWNALKDKTARWTKEQIIKLDPAYSRYMGVEELKPPSSTSKYVQIPNRQITISPLVSRILDTRSFRRLCSLNQLGLVDLIYPGAGYRRYQHCLRAYGYCCDVLLALSNSPDFRLLFTPLLARQTLVLALLHDINHFPFLHTFQELNWPSFKEISLLDLVCDGVATGDHPSIYEIVEDETGLTPNQLKEILFEDHASLVEKGYAPGLQIAKSLIDSGADIDKLAYLEDDSAHTGVSYGRGIDVARLISSATVARVDAGITKGWHLAYKEEGTAAVESLVMARYWMFRSVYWHRVNRAFMSMLLEVARAIFPDEPTADPQGKLFAEIPPTDTTSPIRKFIIDTMWKSEESVIDILNDQYKNMYGGDSIIADLLKQPSKLYKRLFSLQGTDLEPGEQRVREVLQGYSRGQVYDYRKRLVAKLNEKLKPSTKLRLQDVLLDIPGRRLDPSGSIYIVRDSGEPRLLSELEGPVKHVLTEFSGLAKRIRIFVAPTFEPSEPISTPQFRKRMLEVMYDSIKLPKATELK